MSNQIKLVWITDNVVTNIGIGTTTNGEMGTVVGLATTSSVNVGYAYSNGNFISPYTQISADQKWEKIRVGRNKDLLSSDWTILPDSPFNDAKIAEWKTYRQALRDLPTSVGNPDDITWPTKPS